MTSFQAARQDPEACFDKPASVLARQDFSKEQKIEILRQWEYDALQLEVATEENMPPAEDKKRTSLADIHLALEALGETGQNHPGATKFG